MTLDELDRAKAIEARLLAWGWPRDEAWPTAWRIACRDSAPPPADSMQPVRLIRADPVPLERDDRPRCRDCRHFRPAPKARAGDRCGNWKRAGLRAPDVYAERPAVPPRCHAFEPADGRGPQA